MKSTLAIDLITTDQELLVLEEEWKDLVDQTPGITYFLTWEFTILRWKHFREDKSLYVLTARDGDGSLVGIAPWVIATGTVGALQIKRLEFLCRVEIPFRFQQYFLDGEELDIIAHPEYRDEAATAFTGHLDEHRENWDIVDLAWLSPNSPLAEYLSDTTKLVFEHTSSCRWTHLPDDWDTYARETLGKKRAKKFAYKDRLLGRRNPGKISYRVLDEPDEIGPAVEYLDRMKLRQFAARGLEIPPDDDPVTMTHRQFKRELAEAAWERGWWRFYELRVGNAMIAASYGIVLHGNYFGLQSAYEPEWGTYSPGNLVLAFEVKELINEGVREYDPGHGMNESKRIWTDLEREDVRIIANHGWRGMPYFARETAMIAAKEHGRTIGETVLPQSAYTWIKDKVRESSQRLKGSTSPIKQVSDNSTS